MGRKILNRKFKAICLECGKRFTTGKMLPSCPKCGGGDIELAAVIPGLSLVERTE